MKELLITFFISFSLQSMTILIDPGHGGTELGASKFNDERIIFEKDLTLKWAHILKNSLQERGHLVYLSRIQDVTKSLQERAGLADQVKADFFLSLHFNASEIKEHNGFEMYYLDNASNKAIKKIESVENNEKLTSDHDLNKLLLDIIVTQTSQQSKFIAREIENNFIKSITPKHHVRLRKTQAGLFYVLALSQRPSLLLEAGFMSHLVELKKIEQDEYLQDLSEVIAKAMTSDK